MLGEQRKNKDKFCLLVCLFYSYTDPPSRGGMRGLSTPYSGVLILLVYDSRQSTRARFLISLSRGLAHLSLILSRSMLTVRPAVWSICCWFGDPGRHPDRLILVFASCSFVSVPRCLGVSVSRCFGVSVFRCSCASLYLA